MADETLPLPAMTWTTNKGAILLSLLLVLLIGLRFPAYFTDAVAQQVIEPWGDGYKTYHALRYHATYDSTLAHFGGMNYPYGEHAIPGDTQPMLSNPLQLLRRWGLDLTPYSFAVLHFSLLLSLFLSGLLLYAILRRLHLPVLYSVAVAIGLAFLAPQLNRMETHYGLGQVAALPLLLWCLLRYHERPGWRWSLATAGGIWFFAGIHFYFFAILSAVAIAFLGVRMVYYRDWRALPRYGLHLAIMVGVPAAIYFGWLHFTDPVTDRNVAPWGFFAFHLHLEGLLTSLTQPHWRWFDAQLVPIRRVNMESWSYLGLVAIAGLAALGLRFLRRGVRKPALLLQPVRPQPRRDYLAVLGLAAALILLFAFGLPFTWVGSETLLEYTGPIRQFRSVGRFAWVFFYAANLAVFYWLWQRFGTRRQWVLYLALAVLGFEAYHFTRAQSLELDPIAEWRPGAGFPETTDVDYGRYQAIIPIPYYNIGSDNFWWQLSGLVGQKSQTLSMQTGLPLTAAMLTRTSLAQTFQQLQLVTEPYRPPALLADLPDARAFLMVWDAERQDEKGYDYRHLLRFAEPVYADPPIYFYELPLASFAERLAFRRDSLLRILRQDSLVALAQNLRADTAGTVIYESFEGGSTMPAYRGTGGYAGPMAAENILLDTLLPYSAGTELVVAWWTYLGEDRNGRTGFRLAEYTTNPGEPVQAPTAAAHNLARVFDTDGWVLLEQRLILQTDRPRLRLTGQFPLLGDRPLRVDELLVRPAGLSVFGEQQGELFWNGRFYPLE